MLRTRDHNHALVLAGFGLGGVAALVGLTLAPTNALRPLELSWGLFAAFAMAAGARAMATRVFQRVLVALDSAFYIASAFTFGLLAAGWMVILIRALDPAARYMIGRRLGSNASRAPAELITELVTSGGVPTLGLLGVGLLYGIDSRWPLSDWQIAVLEPVFALTFLTVHYSVTGNPHLLGDMKVKLSRGFLSRVVLGELFLVPLALAMVIGHEYQGNGLFILLGANGLAFSFIFRQATISSSKLYERIEELETLNTVGSTISRSLERGKLVSQLAEQTLALVRHSSRFMIGLVEHKKDMVSYELLDEAGRSYRRINAPRDEGLSGWVMLHREPLLLGDVQHQYRLYSKSETYNDPKFNSWLGAPLVIGDDVIGVVSVQSESVDAYTDDHLRVLATIAKQAAVALENSRLYELATVDGLTGLLVRRHFEQQLEQKWAESVRYNREFTLGMFDLDDFKGLNDTYGHQAGDRALQAVAGVLRRNMRSADISGRYGGEEFAFILPCTRLNEGVAMSERLRTDLELLRIVDGDIEVHLTASIGLAAYPNPNAKQPTDLIELADDAMYRAKRLGKNRVCASASFPPLKAIDSGREQGAL